MFSLQYSTHTTQLLGWKEVANRFHELSGSDTWKPRSDSHTESQTGYAAAAFTDMHPKVSWSNKNAEKVQLRCKEVGAGINTRLQFDKLVPKHSGKNVGKFLSSCSRERNIPKSYLNFRKFLSYN